MPPEPAPRAVGLVAREVGLAEDEWIPYGRTKAKIPLAALQARRARPNGKLVVVSSITPTPAGDLAGLRSRLARRLVAFPFAGKPVLAGELGVTGAMAALLRDAIQPNLVQTLEGTPALVHGGPFANIAHGCNSVVATKLALKLGDVCVTEAGFGFDLGAEKFFDIKCRYAGLTPDAVVLVATVRALKYHGTGEDLAALERGMANLDKHVEAIRLFRVPLLVAINRFPSDTERELGAVIDHAARLGVKAVVADVFARGGEGGVELARHLLDLFAR